MDIVQEIRKTVSNGIERLRDAIAAVTLTDTPGLLQDAVQGREDALAELRQRWQEDPQTTADTIVKVVKPMVEAATTKRKSTGADIIKALNDTNEFNGVIALRLLRAAFRQQRQAPPPKPPAPDTRPVVKLADDQPVHITATTLAAIGVPLRMVNVAEEWDDPDDDDATIQAPPDYRPAYVAIGNGKDKRRPIMQPVYDLPAFPFGVSPIADRARTFVIFGDSGELVDLNIINQFALPLHYTHGKGDPVGTMWHPKPHIQYDDLKWNPMYAAWLAHKLAANTETSRRLDDLSVEIIKGETITIVTHEYSNHGQQIVYEILRRARAGVRATIAAPEQADLQDGSAADGAKVRTPLRQVGSTPQHWLDAADAATVRTSTAKAKVADLHITVRATPANVSGPQKDRFLVLFKDRPHEIRHQWLDGFNPTHPDNLDHPLNLAPYLASRNSATLDALALKAANGVRMAIISGRRTADAKTLALEIARRASQGVKQNVTVKVASRPSQGITANASTEITEIAEPWFDWRNIVKVDGADATLYQLVAAKRYVLCVSGEGKLVEATPDKVTLAHGRWERQFAADGTQFETLIWKKPANANGLRAVFQPVITAWFGDEPNGGVKVNQDRSGTLSGTIQAPGNGGFYVYPSTHAGEYVPLSKRQALAEELQASIEAEKRQALIEKRQPNLPEADTAYLAGITYRPSMPRIELHNPDDHGSGGRFDAHDQQLFTAQDEDAVTVSVALVNGDNAVAELIRQGFDAEAAAEIAQFDKNTPRRRSQKTEALDAILADTYANQQALIDNRRMAERGLLWNAYWNGEITEDDLVRYALDHGYRDMRITVDSSIVTNEAVREELRRTNADTMVQMHSAVAQLMGLAPVIVEINGIALDEAQQLEVNKGRRYLPTPTPSSSTPTPWVAPYKTHEVLPAKPQYTWIDRTPAWAPKRRQNKVKGKGRKGKGRKGKVTLQYRLPAPPLKPMNRKTYPTYWQDIAAGRCPVYVEID